VSIRIGLLGCGFMGLAHAVALRALIDAGLVDAELTVVHDQSSRKAEGLAALVGARLVPAPGEVAAGADAVWVCTPTATHLELVRLLADARRAVFCEKPVGRSADEAASVTDVVAQAGVPHQVGLVLRHAPVFTTLRRCLAEGRFGRLMTIAFRDDQFLPVQGHYASTWRADAAVAGGGTLLEHSVHDLDLLARLGGAVRSVTARTSSFAGNQGIEDLASVLLEFDGGRTAALTSVWHQVLSRGSTRRVEVFGEDAVAWLEDEWVGPLFMQTSDGLTVVECPHPPWAAELRIGDQARDAINVYAAEDRAFLDALATGTPPQPGIDEALTAHRLVDAAYRSAAEGRPVSPDVARVRD
jgi:predicted dehydrogenase